jgi:prephenate dehydrogenase
MFKKIVIIGVGLIGGSLGMALVNRSLAATVVGFGRSQDNLRLALECGAVHQITTDLAQAVVNADLVILATHIKASRELLREILPWLSPQTVVTDVGSAKIEIINFAGQLMPPDIFFVGGHPMAGSERQGIKGADPYLFENAFYILTPLPNTPPWVLGKVRAMVEGIGARVIEMIPEEHDRAVAALSHLPHMVAVALVNSLASMPEGEKFLPLAAGGFRDTTRIAMSNPQMWRDIFLSNSDLLLAMARVFRQQLDLLESAVACGDEQGILDFLTAAKEVRLHLPAKTKGYLPLLFEILITVPDLPGSIADVAGRLGREGINIADIEILRVREGEGGSIRLAFAAEKEQEAAVKALRSADVQVVKR